jgi:hypothetical protein
MAGVLKALEAASSVLLVDNGVDNRNLDLSSRNLPGVTLALTREVTVYDLLKHKHVVLSEEAAKKAVGGPGMSNIASLSVYRVLRRPIVTEKSHDLKDNCRPCASKWRPMPTRRRFDRRWKPFSR